MTPIFAGEVAVAEEAIDAIEEYQATGAPPEAIRRLIEKGAAKDESNAIVAFFQRMAFDTYRAALTTHQARMLSAACVFSPLPIPRAALETAGAAAGIEDASAALNRLLGLGLVDDWGLQYGGPHAAANPLARPLADDFDEPLSARVGGAALASLAKAWRKPDGDFRWDAKALEFTRLALAAPDPDPKLLDSAAQAAGRFLFQRELQAPIAHEAVLQPALAKLEAMSAAPTAGLLLAASDCADRLGETDALDRAIEMLEELDTTGAEHAATLLRIARRRRQQGDVGAAEIAYKAAADGFLDAGMTREWAIARGGLGDILAARGDLDGALRIRTEEELPVYERLGDLFSMAVTQGQIADILEARGEPAEALRIRTEEQLPVFERFGDAREVAVVMGKIADTLEARGELDEALRIRTEEELPVYERLGDLRLKALTHGQIADILETRGDLDEALRIRVEEQLPVYDRLGDVRETAVTQGKIGDILYARGELDEALRIRTEEQLPVFERLGDVREQALTKGRIADILEARGEIDEAMRIRTEEELPVYERLGDVRTLMRLQGKIARSLEAQGDLDKALALQEDRLPVARRLDDIDSIAHALFSIADLRLRRGDHERGGIQEIHDGLAEAFAVNRKLGRPDGIGAVGLLLGQVLAMGGYKAEAKQVFDQAERAFERLGNERGLSHVRGLKDQVERA